MIRHILFDLDNTIYSIRYGLEDDTTSRLREYSASWLGIGLEEFIVLQKDAYKRWGTTIGWLTHEKGFTDVDDYYAYIYPENEADPLPAHPELRRFLESLPLPCSILTNSPASHADRVIKKMGLEGIFKNTFDIIGNRFRGKPEASSYYSALDSLNLKPEEVLFIDDLRSYVEGYIAIGGKGILFDEMDVHTDYPHERIKSLFELRRFV